MREETIRVLIWGKTYPELSKRYTETVCTPGVREDEDPGSFGSGPREARGP